MATQGISWTGVLVRLVLAVALVLLSYNPSGHSFYHWLAAPPLALTGSKALAGVALLICWVVCLRSAYLSMGMLGMLLGSALLASLVWVLIDMKLIDAGNQTLMAWITLGLLGVLLGMGLGWALIRQRLTGQVEAT